MTRHSSSQKGNIAHECAEIVRPEGRYNHSDRCIPEGAGSCPLTTRTANTLRFKGTYWDWTKLQQYIERDTGGSGGGGLRKIPLLCPLHTDHKPLGRDPFNQNFRKFRSKTEWICSVQPERFPKNHSTFRGGPLLSIEMERSIWPYRPILNPRTLLFGIFHVQNQTKWRKILGCY